MIARIIIAAMLASTLMACGVKTELDRPDSHMMNGRMMQSDENDPSRPPHPLGEGNGGEDMPFPTGP